MAEQKRDPSNARQNHGFLAKYLDVPDFRAGQLECLSAFMAGKDVAVILPCGGGKTLPMEQDAKVLPATSWILNGNVWEKVTTPDS